MTSHIGDYRPMGTFYIAYNVMFPWAYSLRQLCCSRNVSLTV